MKLQIAKTVFLLSLDIMKKILDLIAFKVNRKSEDYQFYRKEIMNYTYKSLKKLFRQLSDEKVIEKCECKHSLRKGYSDCSKCGGSGYKNREVHVS